MVAFYMFFIAYSNFTLPLVKVAGFSVGGVMVSTVGSDPVDRGSTPFLPTTFISYIWVFVFSHWSVKIGGFISQRGVGGCMLL